MNQEEANEKIVEIMNKEDDLSQKKIKLFKELIFQCDLKQQDKYGFTPLMYAFIYNKDQNLNLTVEQWDYLIKNSDLKQKNNNFKIPLIYALQYNKSENLNINEEQWDYLIKNSNLKQTETYGWSPLMYALEYNKTQNLKLKQQQFKEMYDALDEEQKQITFQNLIQENDIYNKNFVEEMNVLLYDCKFKPNQETINWLKENKNQDIVQMIEKRDVFFKLNQDLKEINNVQKIATIKL